MTRFLLQEATPIQYGNERTNESEEIATLRSQIDQLAKILEKVVDDVYEEEPVVESAPVEESKKENKKELRKAAIPAFLKIVAESNISEEALSEIIDMIKGDLK